MATVQEKLRYLIKTKDIIKRKIQYFVIMPDWTPFRKYADYIGMIGSKVCAHDTNVLYIPAPRIKTAHTVELPVLTHDTIVTYIPTPKLKVGHTVTINNLEHDTITRRTVRNLLTLENRVTLPTITHETEVL